MPASIELTTFEWALSKLSPKWARQRYESRMALQSAQGFFDDLAAPNLPGGYQAGKTNRLSPSVPSMTENAVPHQHIVNLRAESWDMYRNDTTARKAMNSLGAKVVGPSGMVGKSAATTDDGDPHEDFRKRANEIWAEIQDELDHKGMPGTGGVSFADMQLQAVLNCALSGGMLWQVRQMRSSQQRKENRLLPIAIQLINIGRLDSGRDNGDIFRGIELDNEDRRVAYWLTDKREMDNRGRTFETSSKRIPISSNIYHLYVQNDIDQMIGAPWMAPALPLMRECREYEYTELVAMKTAANVVFTVTKEGGGARGLPNSVGGQTNSMTDMSGNPVMSVSPALLAQLSKGEKLEVVNPSRSQTGNVAWADAMKRSAASGLPGTKATTITQDFAGSSYSSEKAHDNDVWPEILILQSWFCRNFLNLVYRHVITSAVEQGMFRGIVTPAEFMFSQRKLLAASWAGPVPKSVNPKDDIQAAVMRIAAGLSSHQDESGELGKDLDTIHRELVAYISKIDSLEIPDEVKKAITNLAKDKAKQDAQKPQGAAA